MSTMEDHEDEQDAMCARYDADRHDAEVQKRDERMTAAIAVLAASLDSLEATGSTIYRDAEGSDKFAMDTFVGHYVDFLGVRSPELTFDVELKDGFKAQVVFDVDQMGRFADRLEAFEYMATDPLSWCLDAVDIAKRMRAEQAEAAA